jgi:predicted nucleotidyltransferase
MRFHDTLDDLFGNTLRVRVLRALTRSPGQRFTGRELARCCDGSPSQTIAALQALEESGVVLREVAGPSHVWRLSTSHVLASRLIQLFDGEAELTEILKREVKAATSGPEIQRAWLFGSVARREEIPRSDVDLLVQVRSAADKTRVEEKLGLLSPQFAIKFGNPLSSVVLTRSQVLGPRKPGLVASAQREGIAVQP